MTKFKNLNNISDELLKQIPALETGQEVVFQMLNGYPNNDMDRNEREKNPVLFGKTQLQTKLKIKDPATGRIVDIGVPQGVDNDSVISYKPFVPGLYDSIFTGKFSLLGGRVEDEELFEILWLSPEREGSPCANPSIKPVFRIINHKEESQQVVTRISTLRKALKVLEDFKDSDFTQMANSLNYPDTDPDAIKAKINLFAKAKPEDFLKIHEDPDTKVRSNIKRAIDAKVLEIDQVTGKVVMAENEITTISKQNMNDQLGAMALFVKSAKNGKDVYEAILKQLG